MKRFIVRARISKSLAALAVAAAIILPIFHNGSVSHASPPGLADRLKRIPESGNFILFEGENGIGCRAATAEEVRLFSNKSEGVHRASPLSASALSAQGEQGLTIKLNPTAQLRTFPEAEAAFMRAAKIWEDRIQSPITIEIDVDFGTKRFGETYPRGVLGSTDTQDLGSDDAYAEVRDTLISGASSDQERALYNTLPQGSLPTDVGQLQSIIAPSTVFRALGVIERVANPDAERQQFGDPPSIGFNSTFAFDFNPADGIDSDKFDFEAVAVHEIGHALGFASMVGLSELTSGRQVAASVWDLFRFRPRTTNETFSTAQRILSTGGNQTQYAAGLEVLQSTGGLNGSGGDNQQSSHWKDDVVLGRFIGIMDPTLARGDREQITSHDLAALDLMGHTLKGGIDLAPEAGNFVAIGDITSGTLTIVGGGADVDGDVTRVDVQLLGGAGQVVRLLDSQISGTTNVASFNLEFLNVDQLVNVRQVKLLLTDSQGRQSTAVTSDIVLDGAPNRPTLSGVSFNGKKLNLKGGGLSGTILLEINGAVVAEKINSSGSKLKLKGKTEALNLRAGAANSIRVIAGNLRSDSFTFSF